jgi:hypothetical protein
MIGSGSPEGVVPASPMAFYLDEDSDELWCKKTGYFTNTGWVLINAGGGGGGISNGDKGDIVVSGGGGIWEIDDDVITSDHIQNASIELTKLQEIAAGILLGRATSGSGGIEGLVRLPFAPVDLTDQATIATNCALGQHFRVILEGNRTLGAPTNPLDGQRIVHEFIQDATGGRTLVVNNANKWHFGVEITSVTLSTTPSKRDFMTSIYHQNTDRYNIVGFVKGY